MKTAISIPDRVFRSAESTARRLKVSRSELYAAAVADYVARHAASGVTEALDAVHAGVESSRLDPALAAAQLRVLGRERWQVRRGDLWWASLPDPVGSGPGFRRPVAVIQADSFNASRIGTVIVAVVTSNLHLAQAPGNVFLKARATRLRRDSVANVSQLITLDRSVLTSRIGRLPPAQLQQLDEGLRLALDL